MREFTQRCDPARTGWVARDDPMGIRTPVAGLKSPCPRPLDDGAKSFWHLRLAASAAGCDAALRSPRQCQKKAASRKCPGVGSLSSSSPRVAKPESGAVSYSIFREDQNFLSASRFSNPPKPARGERSENRGTRGCGPQVVLWHFQRSAWVLWGVAGWDVGGGATPTVSPSLWNRSTS